MLWSILLTVNRTHVVTNTERRVSIALHTESNNSTDNPVVEQTVIDPNGLITNKNEFSADGQ
jgi:hypothetical protein